MKRKPWTILLLALYQWLSPVGNYLVSALGSRMSLYRYWDISIHHLGILGIARDFVIVPAVAGVVVYAVKPWSYPVFLGLLSIFSYQSLNSALESGASTLGYVLVFGAIFCNLMIATYLLLPSVRRPFYERKLRWWEAKQRYLVGIPIQIYLGKGFTECESGKVVNISTGGALIEWTEERPAGTGSKSLIFGGDIVSVKFRGPVAGCPEIFCEARVAHVIRTRHIRAGDTLRIGIEFHNLPDDNKRRIERLVRGLKILGAPALREEAGILEDVKFWTRRLVDQSRRRWAVKVSNTEAMTKENPIALPSSPPSKPKRIA